jgi:GNAT superfamily N-acetyltransferase
VRLRRMRLDDVADGLRLCRASRWNQIAHDWEVFLALSADGCRVAVDDMGQVVGSVATVRYGNAFGWVAMVLVDPAHRGAGIGTQLLNEALVLLDDMPAIRLDATPAGANVYARAGFAEELSLQRMQRGAGAGSLPTASDVPMRPMAAGDIDGVMAWDADVFGADRGVLLQDLLLQAPDYAWVAGEGELEGYLFGRHGHDFEHLGPLVARNDVVARRLVSDCLRAHPGRPYILDAPEQPSWVSWLGSLGFTSQRPFTRMYRGQRQYQPRPDQLFAIMGPEFG